MLLTEAEAKTKWCPFARVVLRPGAGAGNRKMGGDWGGSPEAEKAIQRASNCFGSDCGAWRWKASPREEVAAHDNVETDQSGFGKIVHVAGTPGRVGKGYCGLAGVPRQELNYFSL